VVVVARHENLALRQQLAAFAHGGHRPYDELGPDAGAAEPKCTDQVGVTGVRVPTAAADLRSTAKRS
jgi:hypothetical protein